MLKDRRSSQKPSKYPRQNHLPTPDQLRDIYQTSVKNPNNAVELPFGECYVLSASRRQAGGCEWTLYRHEDGAAMPEWQYNSTDPRWICMQIMSTFPNWNPVRNYSKGSSANDGWVPPPEHQDGDGPEHALMEGEIGNVPLPSVFHSINRDALTGKLEVHADGRVVTVFVNDGMPVQCRLGKREGLEAFSALAAFSAGKFYFYAGPRTERRQLPKDLESLLQSTFGTPVQKPSKQKGNAGQKVGTFKAMGSEDSDKEEVDYSHIRNPLYSEEAPVLLSHEAKAKAKSSNAKAREPEPPDVVLEEDPEEGQSAEFQPPPGAFAPPSMGRTRQSAESAPPRAPLPSTHDDEDPFDVLEAEFNPPTVQAKPEKKKANPFGNLSQQSKGPSAFAKLEPHLPPPSAHHEPPAPAKPEPAKAPDIDDFVPPAQLGSPVTSPFAAVPPAPSSPFAAPAVPAEPGSPFAAPAVAAEPQSPFAPPPATPVADPRNPFSSVPEAVSSVPEAVSSVPQAVSSVPQAVSSVPQAVSSVPQAAEPTSPFAAPAVPIEPGSPFAAPSRPEHKYALPPTADKGNPPFSAALPDAPTIRAAPSPWGPPPGTPEFEEPKAPRFNPWQNAQTPVPAAPAPVPAMPDPPAAAVPPPPPPQPWAPPPKPVAPTSADAVSRSANSSPPSPPTVSARTPQFLDWPSMQPTLDGKKSEPAPPTNKEEEEPPAPWMNLPSTEQSQPEAPKSEVTWVEPQTPEAKPAGNLSSWMTKNLSQPRGGEIIRTGEQPPLSQAELEQLWMAAEADFANEDMPEDESAGSTSAPKISVVEPIVFPHLLPEPTSESPMAAETSSQELPLETTMAVRPSADHPVARPSVEMVPTAAKPSVESAPTAKIEEAPVEPPSAEIGVAAEARSERTRKTKWPSQDIEIYKSADIHGYSKNDRFQVRMTLVNRETQLLAYPVLMYLTEMEFVRAARYNRSFSFLMVQIGVQPDDASSPILPLPNDGLALLGTKIMDIKRSPDLLGHFEDTKGLAILMPETERKSADKLAHRIAKMISDLDVAEWTNWKPLRFRIGLAGAPDNGTTLPQLISEAMKYQLNNNPTEL